MPNTLKDATTTKYSQKSFFRRKFDFAKQVMSYSKYRVTMLLLLLAAISIYKPHALFLTLSTMQILMNIVMNCIIDLSVGAAVYLNNIF